MAESKSAGWNLSARQKSTPRRLRRTRSKAAVAGILEGQSSRPVGCSVGPPRLGTLFSGDSTRAAPRPIHHAIYESPRGSPFENERATSRRDHRGHGGCVACRLRPPRHRSDAGEQERGYRPPTQGVFVRPRFPRGMPPIYPPAGCARRLAGTRAERVAAAASWRRPTAGRARWPIDKE
jgi:hypothetical protein